MARAELADGSVVENPTEEQRAEWDATGIAYKLVEDDGTQTVENFVSPRVVEAPEE
jgi:hypothetical protein